MSRERAHIACTFNTRSNGVEDLADDGEADDDGAVQRGACVAILDENNARTSSRRNLVDHKAKRGVGARPHINRHNAVRSDLIVGERERVLGASSRGQTFGRNDARVVVHSRRMHRRDVTN